MNYSDFINEAQMTDRSDGSPAALCRTRVSSEKQPTKEKSEYDNKDKRKWQLFIISQHEG